ncbi:MAG: rhodanese-like domain-containing protein [Gammaproteobacteria bacterium]|nr:MAG: rhodanese-like domain-containing protein [Gammaproteobacteria bacterium]
MKVKTYKQMIEEALTEIPEVFPWDLEEISNDSMILLDIREPYEFEAMHIKGSINVPRGILEQSCEWDYEETIPHLVCCRQREIVVICRSGYRSVLAAYTMKQMGYTNVKSMKTGLRGWNDYELPMVDADEQPVSMETADEYFTNKIREDQLNPDR